MLNKARQWLYEFARDHIAPVEALEEPDIGVAGFDGGLMHGKYAGRVTMPPASEVTDATALALLLSAQWVSAFANRNGMTRAVLKESDYSFVVKWQVEFVKAEASDDATVADPAGIRAAIESLMDATDPYEVSTDDVPQETKKTGVVLSISDARERRRGDT